MRDIPAVRCACSVFAAGANTTGKEGGERTFATFSTKAGNTNNAESVADRDNLLQTDYSSSCERNFSACFHWTTDINLCLKANALA